MGGFVEAVVACDMLKSCSFCLFAVARSGSCGPTKKVVLAQHQVIGLVPQGVDTEKFPKALGFISLDPFFFS